LKKANTTQYLIIGLAWFPPKIRNAYSEPLGIIALANAEQSFKWIVSWNDESGKVGKKLATNVEENEEEISRDQPEEGVDLGNWGLLLKVVQGGILGKLESCQQTVLSSCIADTRVQGYPTAARRYWRRWLTHFLIYLANVGLRFLLERHLDGRLSRSYGR
jgi:hypothetical protein